MKRIVICFDGTWNRPADEALPVDQQVETNVRRFYESVLDEGLDGTRQKKWYDEGVGTHWYDRYLGAGLGVGLEINIIEGYKFLVDEYEDGDEIYILGFSRGAYTARSLVGLIRNCGLVKKGLNKFTKGLTKFNIGKAYGIYRTRDDGVDSETARDFRERSSREIDIQFVGVWDTVGALGIPLDIVTEANMKLYQFHDTNLSSIVKNAYHAIALDENRKHYDVGLWDPQEAPQQTIEQRWFAGAHCDVGGGYPQRELSDIALRWMQDKAMALGLQLSPVEVAEKNYLGQRGDSYIDFIKGKYAAKYPRHFRSVGTTRFGNEVIDESAQRRVREDSKYVPQNPGFPSFS